MKQYLCVNILNSIFISIRDWGGGLESPLWNFVKYAPELCILGAFWGTVKTHSQPKSGCILIQCTKQYAAIVPGTFSKCWYSSKIAVNQDRVRNRWKQSWEGEGKKGGGGSEASEENFGITWSKTQLGKSCQNWCPIPFRENWNKICFN